MRLGGPIFADTDSPEQWAARRREAGCRAAYRPPGPDAADADVAAYRHAAAAHDLVIAETGARSNPISPRSPAPPIEPPPRSPYNAVHPGEVAEWLKATVC